VVVGGIGCRRRRYFFDLKPVLMSNDAASVKVRRLHNRLLEAEQAPAPGRASSPAATSRAEAAV